MSFNTGSAAAFEDRNVFLPDQERRVELSSEVRVAASGKEVGVNVYTCRDEDHAIGHLLKDELAADPRVSYSAWCVPHPQENFLLLRFHAAARDDPREVLDAALSRALGVVAQLEASLERSLRALPGGVPPETLVPTVASLAAPRVAFAAAPAAPAPRVAPVAPAVIAPMES
jgi:DNA-directed RNA polymerase subunit L